MKAFPSHCVEIYCISFQSEPSERQHKNLGGKKIIVACTIFFHDTEKKQINCIKNLKESGMENYSCFCTKGASK